MLIAQSIVDTIRPICRRTPYKIYYRLRDAGLIHRATSKNASSLLRGTLFTHGSAAPDFRPSEESVASYTNRTSSRRLEIPHCRALDDARCCRFVVLRNPLDRRVSACLDKMVRPGPDLALYRARTGHDTTERLAGLGNEPAAG